MMQKAPIPGIGMLEVLRKHCSEARERQLCLIKTDLLRQNSSIFSTNSQTLAFG